MRILSCQIANFGCLSGRSYSFKEGFNVLCAENGSGKSTLAVFIKAMLYGLPATTKRSFTENERRHYAPWNGGTYGGALEFETSGKSYRIERFFGAKEKDDRFILYDLTTGKPSSDFGVSVGDDLFGVDADGFERSLYISQRLPFQGPDKNITIYKKLGDLLEVSDDLGDYGGANDRLERAARSYRTLGEKGIIWDIKHRITAQSEEIRLSEDAESKCEQLFGDIDALAKQKSDLIKEKEEAQKNREQAERRRLMEEKGASYRRLNTALEQDTRALMPLEAFFSKRLPTETVINEAENVLKQLEEDEVKLSLAAMSEVDRARFADLSARIQSEPTEDETAFLQEKLTHFRAASDEAHATEKKENSEFEALSAQFKNHMPSDGEVDAIHKATDAYDEAEATLLVSEEENAKEKKRLPPSVLICLILSASSLLFTAVSAILSWIPLAVIGGVSALVCAVIAFVLIKRIPHTENAALKNLQACQAKLSALLVPYPYKEKNPSICAKLLFKDMARFRTLSAEEAQRENAHSAALARASGARASIRSILSRYGISDEPQEGIAKLSQDVKELERLKELEKTHARTRALLTGEIQEKTDFLQKFLADYEEVTALSFREALTTLRQKLVLSRECLVRYERDRQALRAFLDESGYDPSEPLPPYIGESAAFAQKEKELSDLLLAVEKSMAELSLELERQKETADLLPAKTAELERLKGELKDAEHTLSLLQTAQTILKDAKEDLSTRYLKDMEAHFDRYLGLLSDKDEKYTFDTDLALSAEREGERRTAEVLSRGEQDLAAFCARLSLIDAIFEKETPVLILDDPFVNLDDKHYARAFALLEKLSARFQILYTVCSSARMPH